MIQKLTGQKFQKKEDVDNDFINAYPEDNTQYIVAQSSTIDPFYDFSLYDNRDFNAMNLGNLKCQGMMFGADTLMLNDY